MADLEIIWHKWYLGGHLIRLLKRSASRFDGKGLLICIMEMLDILTLSEVWLRHMNRIANIAIATNIKVVKIGMQPNFEFIVNFYQA